MSICLSHTSADRALEYLSKERVVLEPVSSSMINQFKATGDAVASVSDELNKLLGARVNDLELLVGAHAARFAVKGRNVHAWTGSLPEGSIAKVCDGLYVSTPAFCLLQQARELHLVNFCQMLGRYLAVASAEGGSSSQALHNRSPLIDDETLSHFVSRFQRIKGAAALQEAMRWVAPGAASPQETNLQLLLTLPPYYHGFGLRKPEMNHEIEVTGAACKLTKKKRLYIDLYWEDERFGLEYQGADHEDTIGDDCERFYALDAMGEHVLYVAKEQMEDAAQMDYIARLVARKLRKKMGRDGCPTESELQDLLDVLAGKRLPSPKEGRWGHGRKVAARKRGVGSGGSWSHTDGAA